MRLLQRYILFELLRNFLFVLSLLTVLLVFVGVFREVSESGLGPLQALQILPYVVPSLLPFTIPATLLLTVCVVYGRIAGDQEVTAAKAAGISVMSLLWPALGLGAVLSFASFWLTDLAIPWAVANIQRQISLALEDIFLDRLRTQHQVINKDRGFSVTVIGVEDKRLIMPTFQYTPPGKDAAVTVQAQEATLEFDLAEQQVMLHLVRGHIDVPGQRRIWFAKEDHPFPLPHEMSRPKPRHQTIREIRTQLDEVSGRLEQDQHRRDVELAFALALGDFNRLGNDDLSGEDYHTRSSRNDSYKMNTEIHSRYAMSASCFFFVLIGGPFAILQAKRQFLTSFMLCFVPILLVYYPLALLMMNLSKTGTVDPWWAMWTANALLMVVGLSVVRRLLKH